jgi:hypothetical protein
MNTTNAMADPASLSYTNWAVMIGVAAKGKITVVAKGLDKLRFFLPRNTSSSPRITS